MDTRTTAMHGRRACMYVKPHIRLRQETTQPFWYMRVHEVLHRYTHAGHARPAYVYLCVLWLYCMMYSFLHVYYVYAGLCRISEYYYYYYYYNSRKSNSACRLSSLSFGL